jgi:hypothetical protein
MLPREVLPVHTLLHDMRVQNIRRHTRFCIHRVLVWLFGRYVFDPEQHVVNDDLVVAWSEDRDLGVVFIAQLSRVLSE